MSTTLYIYVPFELDARGRCCKSRVITASSADHAQVRKYLQNELHNKSPYGVLGLEYHWERDHYELFDAQTTIGGTNLDDLDPTVMDAFEAFDKTIQFYERLNEKGLPFPGDSPVIQKPDESDRRSRPGPRQRHRRGPKVARRAPKFVVEVGEPLRDFTPAEIRRHFAQRDPSGRLKKSHTWAPAPLFPHRGKPKMAFPPRGCHPFVKHRIVTARGNTISQALRNKAFHSYELCDFGDVPRAMREANFKALRRRKGVVIGLYNLGRKPFGIVTDMRDGIAHLTLRDEIV